MLRFLLINTLIIFSYSYGQFNEDDIYLMAFGKKKSRRQ